MSRGNILRQLKEPYIERQWLCDGGNWEIYDYVELLYIFGLSLGIWRCRGAYFTQCEAREALENLKSEKRIIYR